MNRADRHTIWKANERAIAARSETDFLVHDAKDGALAIGRNAGKRRARTAAAQDRANQLAQARQMGIDVHIPKVKRP